MKGIKIICKVVNDSRGEKEIMKVQTRWRE
jgi:hypothetical protein